MHLPGRPDAARQRVGKPSLLLVAACAGERTVAGQPLVVEQVPAQLDLRVGHRVIRRHLRLGKSRWELPGVRRTPCSGLEGCAGRAGVVRVGVLDAKDRLRRCVNIAEREPERSEHRGALGIARFGHAPAASRVEVGVSEQRSNVHDDAVALGIEIRELNRRTVRRTARNEVSSLARRASGAAQVHDDRVRGGRRHFDA
jgi:hypothetical protein